MTELALLHLCDSLFPIGAFAYSDGLESAVVRRRGGACSAPGADHGRPLRPDATDQSVAMLRAWMDVSLDEVIGRVEGPAVFRAWLAFHERDWDALVALDEEMTALRPASSARRSSRAMGLRLLTTWQALHPDWRLEQTLARAGRGELGPTLPVAFAGACACVAVERLRAVEAFAYTRLAATISAAMRLMPIGQTEAHALLSRTLARVPSVVETMAERDADPEAFTPAMDIAAMSQQHLHSRLFRS